MILSLRIFFVVVLCSMLAVTTWAGLHMPVWSIPGPVAGHPWFVATMFDAYFGFFTFYSWQFYREPSWLARVLWFVALVLLGNIAMAIYGLVVTFRLPLDARAEQVLLRGNPVSPLVPATLIASLLLISAWAAIF